MIKQLTISSCGVKYNLWKSKVILKGGKETEIHYFIREGKMPVNRLYPTEPAEKIPEGFIVNYIGAKRVPLVTKQYKTLQEKLEAEKNT